MHIVNIMFARTAGGLEQAFVDYCEGLRDRGHTVTAVLHPGAAVEPDIKALGIPYIRMRNMGEWDPIATWRLKRHLQKLEADIVIAHSNRATHLACKAGKGLLPVVGVAQNYSTRRMSRADAVFTTTQDLVRHLGDQGIPEGKIFLIPNMVRCTELPHRPDRNHPPVIGTMGRFVPKKGFDVFIDALNILKERGLVFRAILGGDGDEASRLKKRAKASGLKDMLIFPGWVKDKKAFYTSIDIFCLPSLHEPFGIVLIEAFTFGAPTVSTDSEGPHEIITPNYDALIVKKGDANAMAEALAKLLTDEKFAANLAANAFAKVKLRYSLEVVCEKIEQALVIVAGR